ncbi:MAG: hypothetical protein ABSG33_01635 [Candidatus Bathyarchaeia archaeon]
MAKEINAALIIALTMVYFDIAMPITLFVVLVVATLLNKRVARKLQSTVEEKELRTKDVILLVVFMAIVISAITYFSIVNPGAIFENVLLIFFLSAYTMLLFTISYVFSNIPKARAQLLSVGFGVASAILGVACVLGPLRDAYTIYRVVAFFGLTAFCFGVVVFEQLKTYPKSKWYVAAQPPAIFVLLFVFLNFINNSGTVALWYPVIMDTFGLTFAVLIILYLSSLFSWKTVGLFAVLLTAMDMILVFSGPMVAAANTFTGLGLPVLVWLPNVPLFHSTAAGNIFGFAQNGLGLGDFFFAGVLTVQTFNKFGRKTAFAAIVAITVAFALWEASFPYTLPAITSFLRLSKPLEGFPATVCILSGWAPIIALKLLSERRKASKMPIVNQPTQTSTEQSSLPTQ